jgi:hypothetical protein
MFALFSRCGKPSRQLPPQLATLKTSRSRSP